MTNGSSFPPPGYSTQDHISTRACHFIATATWNLAPHPTDWWGCACHHRRAKINIPRLSCQPRHRPPRPRCPLCWCWCCLRRLLRHRRPRYVDRRPARRVAFCLACRHRHRSQSCRMVLFPIPSPWSRRPTSFRGRLVGTRED